MNRRSGVLVDTGPVVAMLSKSDQYHARCVAQLADLHPPLYTSWPVVTEAQWLLRHDPRAVQGLFEAFASGLFALLAIDEAAMAWLDGFIRRYPKLNPGLADATLVHLAEREEILTVFTFDHRDFSIYRLSGNRRLHIIPAA